ncbi:hypothetical protein F750_2091 [Streptomyces sp. PAMC 26508]|nr:hypothetical protein F750_2091 [Streptomyces sp. PAMC 26508]
MLAEIFRKVFRSSFILVTFTSTRRRDGAVRQLKEFRCDVA